MEDINLGALVVFVLLTTHPLHLLSYPNQLASLLAFTGQLRLPNTIPALVNFILAKAPLPLFNISGEFLQKVIFQDWMNWNQKCGITTTMLAI